VSARNAIFGAVLALLVCALAYVSWVLSQGITALDEPMSFGPDPMRLVVRPGMTLSAVAVVLAERGALAHPQALVWRARWEGNAARIQAGEYELPAGTTPMQALGMLVQGKVVQWSFTIIEGWTFADLRSAIDADRHLVHTLQGAPDADIMARLGQPGSNPEGWFYPETYRFPGGTTDIEFLSRAHNAMQRHLKREWTARRPGLPYAAPYEALVMASIVEKETGRAEERARIAGVFVRRLKKRMRLEADPTVIYGMGAAFDGNLRRKDLRQDTPYNTYVHRGLPPTPIALAGGEALHAALNPSPGEDLFFVAKGDGTHHFSPTYAEHKQAVERYQVRRASRGKTGG